MNVGVITNHMGVNKFRKKKITEIEKIQTYQTQFRIYI